MSIRDRVVGLRRVQAKSLKPSPKNWRTHPKAQRDALNGMLEEVGIAGAVLARVTEDGSLMLIDGHLRAEELDQEIPVLILDVTEAEADKLLATVDPLSALAGQDDSKLIELLQGVKSDSAAVQKMLGDLVTLPTEPKVIEYTQKFEIMIECENEKQQVQLLGEFLQRNVKAKALLS